MMSKLGMRSIIGSSENSFGDEYGELGLLLREQRRTDADDLEKELNLYRSGSAPPTVEGSISAVGELFNHGAVTGVSSAFAEFARNNNANGFVSEEELRSDPSYLSYYYANVNLNPRLPPPLFSREDWRYAQRIHGGSSAIGDKRKVNKDDGGKNGGRLLFSMPTGFNSMKQENQHDNVTVQGSEWGGDGLTGLPGLGLPSNQKSLAEIFQDDLGRATPASGHLSRPASRNAFDENPNALSSAQAELAHLRRDLSSSDLVYSVQNSSNSQHGNSSDVPYSYAAALGASLSRSSTPDPPRIAQAPSPCLTPIGSNRTTNAEKRTMNSLNSFNNVTSHSNETVDLVTALSSMNLSNGIIGEENNDLSSRIEKDADDPMFNLQGAHNRSGASNFQKNSFPSNNSYLRGSSNTNDGVSFSQYQHSNSPNSSNLNHGLGGYPMSPIYGHLGASNLPPLFENAVTASAMDMPATTAQEQ